MTVNTGLVIVPLLLRVFDHGVVLGASLLLELCNYHISQGQRALWLRLYVCFAWIYETRCWHVKLFNSQFLLF